MADAVQVKGLDEIVKALNTDLDGGIRPVLIGLAEEARAFIAPYPAAPSPSNPRSYYVRGTGTYYVRKGGGTTVRKTSENLGRRWRVEPRGGAAVALENTASYANYVHGTDDQTRKHAATGWKTEDEAKRFIEQSGAIEELAQAYIRKVLGL